MQIAVRKGINITLKESRAKCLSCELVKRAYPKPWKTPEREEFFDEAVASLDGRFSASGGVRPDASRLALQKNVFHNIGQVREKERLRKGLARLKELREESSSVPIQGETDPKRLKEVMSV